MGGVSPSNYEPAPYSLIFLFFCIAATDTFNSDNFRYPETTHIAVLKKVRYGGKFYAHALCPMPYAL
ncbi:hypothetical protein [Microcoleus sp.]|uniref:hypothetical protein n=1 Tax=Microcoleus sp. TaxID=44472 RepID=UPI00403E5C38